MGVCIPDPRTFRATATLLLGYLTAVSRKPSRGGGANAPRIEILGAISTNHLATFGKKRATLVKEGFERTEIYLGRICLNLPKIRVHR